MRDGIKETVGGMITARTIKHTKNNKMMAFLTLEDLAGTVEIVVFPRDYEKYQRMLGQDDKVFIRGRVSEEDDAPSKLICESVVPFEQTRKELWIQYEDKAAYLADEEHLFDMLRASDGDDSVVIYCRAEKAVKRLPAGKNIYIEPGILSRLTTRPGGPRCGTASRRRWAG